MAEERVHPLLAEYERRMSEHDIEVVRLRAANSVLRDEVHRLTEESAELRERLFRYEGDQEEDASAEQAADPSPSMGLRPDTGVDQTA